MQPKGVGYPKKHRTANKLIEKILAQKQEFVFWVRVHIAQMVLVLRKFNEFVVKFSHKQTQGVECAFQFV